MYPDQIEVDDFIEHLTPDKDRGIDDIRRDYHVSNSELHILDNVHDQRLNRLRDYFSVTAQVYHDKGAGILSDLPTTLNSFSTYAEIFNNVIGGLNQANINPLEIMLLRKSQSAIKYPTVLEFLNELSDLKALEIVLYSSIQSYTQIIASNSLAKLDLCISGDLGYEKLDILWLFSIFPSLEYLQIYYDGAILVITETTRRYPKLQTLKIRDSLTNSNLLESINLIALNVSILQWRIFGKTYYDSLLSNHKIKHEDGYLDQPEMVEDSLCYKIDTSNFDLDSFYLTCCSLLSTGDKICYGIVPDTHNKRFIIPDSENGFSIVLNGNDDRLENYNKVIIVCDNVKQIMINKFKVLKTEDGLAIEIE